MSDKLPEKVDAIYQTQTKMIELFERLVSANERMARVMELQIQKQNNDLQLLKEIPF